MFFTKDLTDNKHVAMGALNWRIPGNAIKEAIKNSRKPSLIDVVEITNPTNAKPTDGNNNSVNIDADSDTKEVPQQSRTSTTTPSAIVVQQ